MSLCVIELNDADVRVGKGTEIVLHSPGYAVVEGERVHLGEAALHRARLHPRQTYTRFWSLLGQDPLQSPNPRIRHHADLAYAHLLAIHEQAGAPEDVVFAVPGSFSRDQLALLLGIAAACPFRAVGLVDAAVAGAATLAGPGRFVHVEMHLHHTVFTRLAVDGEVTREAVETVDEAGLQSLHDACATLIADTFIQQCRFDPQRQAETEQLLYDRLPGWLRALAGTPEVQLEIAHQGRRHQAKLKAETLARATRPIYDTVIERLAPETGCLLGDRLAGLPGFAGRLAGAEALPPEAVFAGCAAHGARIRSNETSLSFVTRLPAPERPAIAPQPIEPADEGGQARPPVTHVLAGHHAYPLRDEPLYLTAYGEVSTTPSDHARCAVARNGLGASVEPLGQARVEVNGRPLGETTTLAPGDSIAFADAAAHYTLIAAMD